MYVTSKVNLFHQNIGANSWHEVGRRTQKCVSCCCKSCVFYSHPGKPLNGFGLMWVDRKRLGRLLRKIRSLYYTMQSKRRDHHRSDSVVRQLNQWILPLKLPR